MQQRRSTVAGLGFSLVKEGTLFIKLPLMGLCKLKVQINYGPRRFHQKERKIKWWKAQRKKEDLLSFKNNNNKSCAKEIFESIKGCRHPLIASGATPIGSAGRAPKKIKRKE
jgi:hypothetical protein